MQCPSFTFPHNARIRSMNATEHNIVFISNDLNWTRTHQNKYNLWLLFWWIQVNDYFKIKRTPRIKLIITNLPKGIKGMIITYQNKTTHMRVFRNLTVNKETRKWGSETSDPIWFKTFQCFWIFKNI